LAEGPLVSCLMVTLPVPHRWDGLTRSITDYLRQTHARRELIIVADTRVQGGTVEAIADYVSGLGRSDIRLVAPATAASLGALRNVSLAEARGELVCTWDDDDMRHPERVARQVAALTEMGAEGLCLTHVLQFFQSERRLYCTNWRTTDAGGLPASLLCWRSAPIVYPETGPSADRGEDMAVLEQLQVRGRFHVLDHAPHLYVYVSHGKNAYDDVHHRSQLRLAISRGLLRRWEPQLREGLAAFDFGPTPVTVQGANGPAFVIG
jgi:glycosyltransferase involved in cell wall biosynthesis